MTDEFYDQDDDIWHHDDPATADAVPVADEPTDAAAPSVGHDADHADDGDHDDETHGDHDDDGHDGADPGHDDPGYDAGEPVAAALDGPPRRGPARPPRPARRPGRRRPGDTGAVPTPSPVPALAADHDDHLEPADDGHHGHDGHHHAGHGGHEGYDGHDGHDGHDDDEYEDLPPDTRLPRWVLVLGVLVLLIGVVFGGAWFWYERQLDPPGSPGAAVEVQIPQGTSTSGMGSILERNGVIPNAMVFNFYASRKDVGQFQAGVYEFRKNSSVDAALAVLARGPTGKPISTNVVRVLIPEGLTVAEITTRISNAVPRFTDAEIKAALADGSIPSSLRPAGQTSYEGLLFPATYEVGGSKTVEEFLTQLSATMESRVADLDPDAARKAINARFGLDLDTYDLLKVASLVQSEAGSKEEAPQIATVIYNRLAKKSTAYTLGIDASDEYGAKLEGITPSEYRKTQGPYNLRRLAGLPPTPISAPGDYALRAAFNPAEGDWMWYVLTAPRVHTFAVTEAEFNAAKRICKEKGLGCG